MPSAHRIIQRTWPSAVLMIRHFSWTRVWRNWYDHSQNAFWVNFQNWLKQVKGHALPQHWPENSLTCRAAACSCYNTRQVSLVGVLVQPASVCCEQPETLRIKFDSQPSKPGEVTTALVLTEATLPCHEGRECSICNLIHLKWCQHQNHDQCQTRRSVLQHFLFPFVCSGSSTKTFLLRGQEVRPVLCLWLWGPRQQKFSETCLETSWALVFNHHVAVRALSEENKLPQTPPFLCGIDSNDQVR